MRQLVKNNTNKKFITNVLLNSNLSKIKKMCYNNLNRYKGGYYMLSFKYIIELSEQDRVKLLNIVTKGTSSARKILRANILIVSDNRSDKYMTVAEIAETYHTTPTPVQTLRTSY